MEQQEPLGWECGDHPEEQWDVLGSEGGLWRTQLDSLGTGNAVLVLPGDKDEL